MVEYIEIKVSYAEVDSQFVADPPPKWAQDFVKRLAASMAKQLEEDTSRSLKTPRSLYPCGCNATVCFCGGYRIS